MDYKDLQAGQTKEFFWFKAKNDLIDILIKKVCWNRKQLKILNIGVGTGDDLNIFKKYGKNYIIDINKDALSAIDNKLCEKKGIADACNLPFNNDFFDVVVSFDTFEHIKNDKESVSEIYRVLKKNGVLIFTVPAFQFLFSSHDKAVHHQRRYNKKSIRTLLFKFNLEIFFWNSLLFIPFATMRMLKKGSKPKVDQMNLPSWLNILFFHLLKIDNLLIRRGISMPIGLSIVGYGYKLP